MNSTKLDKIEQNHIATNYSQVVKTQRKKSESSKREGTSHINCLIRLTADSSWDTMEAGIAFLNLWKEKKLYVNNFVSGKTILQNENKMKTFLDMQQLREFLISRPSL